MKMRSRQPSLRNSFVALPIWPTEIQWCRNPVTAAGSQAPLSAKITAERPRAESEFATANGIAPAPAMMPTGDAISEAAVRMAASAPRSVLPRAGIGRQA
jgi:hypothetical protein